MSQEKRVEVIKNTNPLSNPNNKFSIRIMDKLKNETIKTVGAPNEKIAIRRAKNELSGWKRPVDEYYLSKIKDVGLTVDILLQDGGTVDFYALIQPI